MTQTQRAKPQSSEAPETLKSLFQVAREDLLMLALLHDRELDRDTLMGLWKECYEEFLGLRLETEAGREALRLFRQGLDDIPTDLDRKTLDILAAEFADIYLNYSLNASPCESVWTNEDGLTMQEAMFQVRGWYAHHGLSVENWRMRPDDHLVTQIQFVSYLLDGDPSLERLEEISRFLDEHLLRWIAEFAERVATRCKTRFYAGLATLTAAYLDELRDLSAALLGSPRPSPEELDERLGPKQTAAGVAVPAPAPFVPGAAPSW